MQTTSPIAIVLHGGAGDRLKEHTSPEKESELLEAIAHALDASYSILAQGGSAISAITEAIRLMELAPCFNAGIGSALTQSGSVELDAGIMDGKTKMTGAVAGVSTIKSPILGARAVMEQSPHVLLIGKGAEQFAESVGLEMTTPDYFITEENKAILSRIRARNSEGDKTSQPTPQNDERNDNENEVMLGTVGAVALDVYGNLASGNSTGGTMNQLSGRVGDVPMAGAGMYAQNGVGAVSATGYGEFFIRTSAAHEVLAQHRYIGTPIDICCANVLSEIQQLGGRGGLIAIDANGTISMQFNTTSMARAGISANGNRTVQLW